MSYLDLIREIGNFNISSQLKAALATTVLKYIDKQDVYDEATLKELIDIYSEVKNGIYDVKKTA